MHPLDIRNILSFDKLGDRAHTPMNGDAEFAKEAVLAERVITLTTTGFQLVFQDSSGTAFPFWSSPSRAEKVRNARPEYEEYALQVVVLSSFVPWLADLEKDRTRIGLNWSQETFSVHYEHFHDWYSYLVHDDSIQAAILKEILERESEARNA